VTEKHGVMAQFFHTSKKQQKGMYLGDDAGMIFLDDVS